MMRLTSGGFTPIPNAIVHIIILSGAEAEVKH